MISSAELLSNFEHCQRWGYYSQSWRYHKMPPLEMFNAAVRQALTEDTPDPGEAAGELMMTFAGKRGLELSKSHDYYRCAINHAAAADLVVTGIDRSPEPWFALPNIVNGWRAAAMMSPDGGHLRRFLAVSSWSEEREAYEKHSWYVLGDIAHYMMPMQMIVAVLGPMNGGRRHGVWSKALFHTIGNQLRFRLRSRSKVEGFKDSWQPVYREEHDEIPRDRWLQSMRDDDVFSDALFVVNVPVPEAPQIQIIRDLAQRQLQRLDDILPGKLYTGPPHIPEKQLTTCRNPLHPCPFRACCWSDPESKPEDGGYDRI